MTIVFRVPEPDDRSDLQSSIRALEQAVSGGRELVLAAQQESDLDDPGEDDLYRVGTLGTIIQLLRLPDGTVKVLVEGKARARVEEVVSTDPCLEARVVLIPEAASEGVEAEGKKWIGSFITRTRAGTRARNRITSTEA